MNIIKHLREKVGYSQQELADIIKVSRQTIINYENGQIPSAQNVQKLAKAFDVSESDILNGHLPVEPSYEIIPAKAQKNEQQMRISIPQENITKFKEVFLYIINKIGSKYNVGQTVLYKILYFIDFDYYEKYEEQLIGAKYIKNTYGPTPVDFAKIVREMLKNGDCVEVKRKCFKHDQTKYLPIREADISCLSAKELEHINYTMKKYANWSAKELSDYSHKDVPWLAAEDRGVIDYEAVFYRTPETSVREYTND
jgi:Predicted transcriptional regulators